MELTRRSYSSLSDLDAMRQLLSAGRQSQNGAFYVHPGDLNWWLFYREPELRPETEAIQAQEDRGDQWAWTASSDWAQSIWLWEAGSQVLGWALLSPEWMAFDVFVHPSIYGTPAAQEMYAWTADRMAVTARARGGRSIRTIWIAEDDPVTVPLLEELGLSRAGSCMYAMTRSLEGPLPVPDLPAGYTIRAPSGENEAASRASAQAAAFESSWPFDRYLLRYIHFMRSPVYPQALDLAAWSPDGRAAAFCIGWLDPATRTGLFEPVGAHPDFRRRGLGKALLLEALRRMQAAGMTSAAVTVETDNLAANRLYQSAGFGLGKKLVTFRRGVGE